MTASVSIKFLTLLLPDQSRSSVQRLIKEGHVSGAVAPFARALPCGQDRRTRSRSLRRLPPSP